MNSARLERIRALQRRVLDAAEADANAAVMRNEAQAERLGALAVAMAPATGAVAGRALGTSCEFVMRLNRGLRSVSQDAAQLSRALQSANDAAVAARRAERSAGLLAEKHRREETVRIAKRNERLLPPRRVVRS